MRTPNESRVDSRRMEWLWLAVFAGLFLYLWKGIQPHLLYHGFGVFTAYPVFSWEWDSLWTAMGTPGGAVDALAAILAQTYRSPLAGALVIAAVVGGLFAGIRRLLNSIQADKLRDLAWLSSILALMIYNRYDDPLPLLLGLGVSIWMAVLHVSIHAGTAPVQAGLFLGLLTLGYWLTGASILVFACTICLVEALIRRRIAVAAVQGALAIGGSLVLGSLLFTLDARLVYTIGTPWDASQTRDFSGLSRALAMILYGLPPVLVLISFAAKGLHVSRPTRRKAVRSVRETGPGGQTTIPTHAIVFLGRVLVVALTAALCLGLTRNHVRDERLLHYYTRQRDWNRAIDLAHHMRRGRAFTRSAVFDINRALAHQGHLGDELCVYPQDETKTLFLSFDDMTGRLQHAKLLELYLDLGCPNAAQKNAYELLDNEGPSPHILEALVRIHLVKGEHESARIVLGALRQYAGCGRWVRDWQGVVADPAQSENHSLLRAWRRVRGCEDHAVGGVSFEPLLKRLLQETPDHRLAMEYLMANYLLKHQRGDFISCLPRLKSLGYGRLPRQYTEAVLVYSLETKTSPETQGWSIDPDVNEQFRRIGGIVKGARGNNQAAFDTLASQYGDTYTFYSLFNVCGAR